jgi:hypothetical protein
MRTQDDVEINTFVKAFRQAVDNRQRAYGPKSPEVAQ